MSDLTLDDLQRLREVAEIADRRGSLSVHVRTETLPALIEAARVGLLLKQLRTAGWVVAAHNDYRLIYVCGACVCRDCGVDIQDEQADERCLATLEDGKDGDR